MLKTNKILKDSMKQTELLSKKCSVDPNDTDSFLRLMFLPLETATKIGENLNKDTKVNDFRKNKEHDNTENQAPQNANIDGKQLSRQNSIGSFGL